MAFDFRGSQVIVTRVENDVHEYPAIGSLLVLLEQDIASGRRISTLPNDLARSMLVAIKHLVDLSQEIDGDVVL